MRTTPIGVPGHPQRSAYAQATCVGATSDAADLAERQLAVLAPELVDGFRAALPRAAATVAGRLAGALWRENVAGARNRPAPLLPVGRRHAFDRIEYGPVAPVDPVDLLPAGIMDERGWALAAELTNAVVNLAIAYARRAQSPQPDASPDGTGPSVDEAVLALERLAVDGHNLHPCGRTRLGWDVADTLGHDLEARPNMIAFVAVPREAWVGDDLGAALAELYPDVPTAPPGHVCQPVHPWQWAAVLRHRYAGELRPLDGGLPAAPTAALRTLLLPPGRDGRRRYLKLSLDIQVTSTRRTISTASTRNGPAVSALLHRLLTDDPAGERVLLLAETAGAALTTDSGRDASAILRDGLDGRLADGEAAVPGGALPAVTGDGRTVLAGLVDAYARTTGRADRAEAALGFVTEYAWLLLPPVLRLAARYGLGLEAHLQNCLPTFVAGVPRRIVFRDFAGMRLHRPRMAAAGLTLPLWPGSVTATDDVAVLRAKVGYTAFQAHLGELVIRLAESHGLDESAAWGAVRRIVAGIYGVLRDEGCAAAAEDHAALTAARVPHKALVRMRLVGSGDVHVPVRNPLHG